MRSLFILVYEADSVAQTLAMTRTQDWIRAINFIYFLSALMSFPSFFDVGKIHLYRAQHLISSFEVAFGNLEVIVVLLL